eukprot:g699.t1
MSPSWFNMFCGAAALTLATAGPAGAAPDAQSIWLPEGFAYPNGVAFDERGGLFVGSVVSGDIAVIELGERPQVRFEEAEGRFAGTAIRYDAARDLLWVSSPDFLGVERDGEIVRRPHRLAVVDASTGAVLWSEAVPGAGFANDIALDGRGGAYVTDTTNGYLLHVPEPGGPFTLVAEGLESRAGAIGPAGLAVDADGSVVVGVYSDGRLVRVIPGEDGEAATVVDLPLDGAIANPDGMAFGPDGRLLVIDGGVASGDGRLLAVDLEGEGPHRVETVVSGLDLPVNLSVQGLRVAVTESRIRHRMVDEPTLLAPDRFRVILLTLGAEETPRR